MNYYIPIIILIIISIIIFSNQRIERFEPLFPNIGDLLNNMANTAKEQELKTVQKVQELQKQQQEQKSELSNLFSQSREQLRQVSQLSEIDRSSFLLDILDFKNRLEKQKKQREQEEDSFDLIDPPKQIPIIPLDASFQMDDCDDVSNGYFDLFKVKYSTENKLKDSIIFVHSDNCIYSRGFFSQEFNKLLHFFNTNPILAEHIHIPKSYNNEEIIDISKYYITCNMIAKQRNIQLQPIFYKSLLNNLIIDKNYTLPMLIYHKPPSPTDVYTYDIINSLGIKQTITQTYKDIYGEEGYDPLNCEHLERNIVIYDDILSFYATNENLPVSDSTYKDEANNIVIDSKIPILKWLVTKCWYNDQNPVRKNLYEFYLNKI